MKRLMTALVVLAFALGVAACEKDQPCDKVQEKMCEAGGEKLCAELEKKMGEQEPTAEDQKECEQLLQDEEKLGEMLDGLKAAAAIQEALDEDLGEEGGE